MRQLLWHINRRSFDTRAGLAVHAGAVEIDGAACLLAAPSNGGKSTLTAALVERGAGYLTDELVTLDDQGRIRPYAKPIVLGGGAHRLLPQLDPGPIEGGHVPTVWLVPPRSVRADPLGRPAPIHSVFFLDAQTADRTQRIALTPAEATVTFLHHIVDVEAHRREALDWAADVATRSRCFRLPANDLGLACDLVADAMAS